MKKIYLLFIMLILMTACSLKTSNTPREAVEDYLSKYQNMDSSLEKNLEKLVAMEDYDNEQKSKYKNVLERQYQNISYKITDEDIDENDAEVAVEIEVLDYSGTNEKSHKYFEEHQEDFIDKVVDKIDDIKEYIDYKIEELSKTEEKTTYELVFNLKRRDNKWEIEEVSEENILKLHGLY